MSSNGGGTDNYWDPFIYMMAAAIVGVPVLTRVSSTAASFLVDIKVLTTKDVLVPLVDGVGLDLGRCLIAGALVALIVLGIIWGFRRRAAAADERSKK